MKVLHVTPAYYPFQEKGGPVFKVRSLAAGLARRGHDVTVVTADLGLKSHSDLQQLERHAFGSRLRLDGAEIIYLATVGHYRALTVNPALFAFCKRTLPQFDVVHCYGLYDFLGPTIAHFCRRLSIPCIVEPMGMYRRIDRSLWRKSLWHGTLGKRFLKDAATIVATSELERRELIDAGFAPAKVILRYNGVDASLLSSLPNRGTFRAKWGISQEEPLVLFLSRLISRKGAELLIEAFAKVCNETGHLVIAGPEGDKGYRAQLEKRAAQSTAAARIIFCGPLYDEEKKAALKDADIFVLPSRYENFANVAAEAMACGVPVIVTDTCGISSLVKDRSGLVIPPRQEALTEALCKLLYDKSLYARFKAGCIRVSAELDWEALTEQMLSHYKDAIS
jgi:glycosyltransferase involved in cell wall biosynthesis